MVAGLFIGEVAARAGVTREAVRLYERRRLLPPAARTGGGLRLFTPEAVERICFIKRAQGDGFTLNEIRGLLTDKGRAAECRRVRDRLRAKLAGLDGRTERIRNLRSELIRDIEACAGELKEHGDAARCPLIAKLSGHAAPPKIK